MDINEFLRGVVFLKYLFIFLIVLREQRSIQTTVLKFLLLFFSCNNISRDKRALYS